MGCKLISYKLERPSKNVIVSPSTLMIHVVQTEKIGCHLPTDLLGGGRAVQEEHVGDCFNLKFVSCYYLI